MDNFIWSFKKCMPCNSKSFQRNLNLSYFLFVYFRLEIWEVISPERKSDFFYFWIVVKFYFYFFTLSSNYSHNIWNINHINKKIYIFVADGKGNFIKSIYSKHTAYWLVIIQPILLLYKQQIMRTKKVNSSNYVLSKARLYSNYGQNVTTTF